MNEPRITSIRMSCGPERRKPKEGDIRVTKKHGRQVRVWRVAKDSLGRPMGRYVSNGRPVFDWKDANEP